MSNYLKDPNNLLVWPIRKDFTENDMFLTHIGVRARYDMTTKELLYTCLDAWGLDKNGNYQLKLIRSDKEIEIAIDDKPIKEIGIRNGDPLQIIAS